LLSTLVNAFAGKTICDFMILCDIIYLSDVFTQLVFYRIQVFQNKFEFNDKFLPNLNLILKIYVYSYDSWKVLCFHILFFAYNSQATTIDTTL